MASILPRSARAAAGPAHAAQPRVRPATAFAVVLLAALAINVETTIVNVALPSLNSALGSSTRGLQWIVDAYNLAFAALVLVGGALGDKVGRRGVLITGLVLFAVTSCTAALCTSTVSLVGARLAMGVSAALIYPATLAIITELFTVPRARAGAIGAWGAVSGLGVAIGPILGGALLESFWWGSVFLALIPAAVAAAVGAATVIGASAANRAARLDRGGALLSVLMLAALVYTIIEAPDRGWLSAPTLVGFGAAGMTFVAFCWWEKGRRHPLIDVGLFVNLRFSAASGAVTVAFFGLFGFIFLIIQFMQELRGFGPLETGVRILPVAVSIAVGSVAGTRLAVTRVGTKAVVCAGLVLLAAAFGWVATMGVDAPYPQIAAQMVLLGGGLGLTTAPATDSIMGVVRAEQAGAGSAVNDATRLIGGTLGVAVLGSIYSTLYGRHLDASRLVSAMPVEAQLTARQGLAQGLAVAEHATGPMSETLRQTISDAFMAGLHASCVTAAAVCAAGALLVVAWLPAHPLTGTRS